MIKRLLILAVFLSCLLLKAQEIITIPDQIFEQALIDQGIDIDGVINGQVTTNILEVKRITVPAERSFNIEPKAPLRNFPIWLY